MSRPPGSDWLPRSLPNRPPSRSSQPAGTQTTAPSQPAKDGGDDGGGVPIWAGIGLMLLAAVAGSAAARARNRRRMRDYMSDGDVAARDGQPGAAWLMILAGKPIH